MKARLVTPAILLNCLAFLFTIQNFSSLAEYSGETTRVSIATDGSEANGGSGNPAISGDGRYVTFESHATNLAPEDTNNPVPPLPTPTSTPDPASLPYRVKDIYPGVESSSPYRLFDGNGVLFFKATDGVHGYELWRSDGTKAGTFMVKDINPGSANSSPAQFFDWDGTLFFSAYSESGKVDLWKSDGTGSGTQRLKEVQLYCEWWTCPGFVYLNGWLYFVGKEELRGYELWKTDGTPAGTVMVKDINPGLYDSFPDSLIAVNNFLFFSAGDPAYGRELWKSDGTEEGTERVRDIYPGTGSSMIVDYAIPKLHKLKDRVLFEASDGTSKEELWVSDGTQAGTVRVKDIWPGPTGSLPLFLTVLNGQLYFSADDGVSGRELWKTDGTPAGTVQVVDLNPGTESGLVNWGPNCGAVLSSSLFFIGTNGESGTEIWKTSGVIGEALLVSDINAGEASSSPSLTATAGKLYIAADDGQHGQEPWIIEDEGAKPVMVTDILPGEGTSYPEYFTYSNGLVFFSAYDESAGSELWAMDAGEIEPFVFDDSAQTSEDQAVGIEVLDNDQAGVEPLSIASVGAPAHGTVVIDGKAVIYTPSTNYFGQDHFTYTAKNGQGKVASAQVAVTVNSVNDPPIISEISDQSLLVNASSVQIPFSIEDVDANVGSLVIKVSSSNQRILPDGNISFCEPAKNCWIELSPAPGQTGQVKITVAVSDEAATTKEIFQVTVGMHQVRLPLIIRSPRPPGS